MSQAGERTASKLKIAVLASGSGSNFQAIVDQAQNGTLPVNIELLVTDRPTAKVVQRAEAAGIDVYAFRPRDYSSREAYEATIVEQLQARGVELIVLAGYMRLITDCLLQPYMGRMINVHPSLLPAFSGLDAVGQALAYGVRVTGVTVHYVDGGMDTGPIIAQQAVEVQPADDHAQLSERIHAVEHRLLPEAIASIASGRVRWENERTVFEEGGK